MPRAPQSTEGEKGREGGKEREGMGEGERGREGGREGESCDHQVQRQHCGLLTRPL